jgi:nucleoside-triphosphatase
MSFLRKQESINGYFSGETIIMIMKKNILLTGKPGVGKTTMIKNIIEVIDKGKIAGFYTQEIREADKRIGFMIIGLGGDRGIMAHVNIKSKYRVGRYGVDIVVFEDIAMKELSQQKEIIIIDEIGKMELFSDRFKQVVISLLNNKSKVVIGTIGKISNTFIERIKHREDTTIIEITRENYLQKQTEIIRHIHDNL